jgi:hypothetical protein
MKETFNIKVTMETRWIPVFLAMLKRMQSLGNVGASRKLTFYSDGDGDFHPKFEWDTTVEPLKEPLEPIKNSIYDAG